MKKLESYLNLIPPTSKGTCSSHTQSWFLRQILRLCGLPTGGAITALTLALLPSRGPARSVSGKSRSSTMTAGLQTEPWLLAKFLQASGTSSRVPGHSCMFCGCCLYISHSLWLSGDVTKKGLE